MRPALRWRDMNAADIPALLAIAAVVHPEFPEDEGVFADRLRLFPAGCRVLVDLDGRVQGYLLSHPWRRATPVPLNVTLGQLPQKPATLYVHDLALLPGARGAGAARAVVRDLLALAARFDLAELSLVAVHDSAPFWARHGFQAQPQAFASLRSYAKDAVFMVRTTKSSH